jgi:hypothetical protein
MPILTPLPILDRDVLAPRRPSAETMARLAAEQAMREAAANLKAEQERLESESPPEPPLSK